MQSQSKISTNYFTDFDSIPKFVCRGKRCSIAKITLTKDKGGKLILPDFMMYYKATVIKTVIKEQTNSLLE